MSPFKQKSEIDQHSCIHGNLSKSVSFLDIPACKYKSLQEDSKSKTIVFSDNLGRFYGPQIWITIIMLDPDLGPKHYLVHCTVLSTGSETLICLTYTLFCKQG